MSQKPWYVSILTIHTREIRTPYKSNIETSLYKHKNHTLGLQQTTIKYEDTFCTRLTN